MSDNETTTRKSPWRPGKHFRLADEHRTMLDCFSPANASTAIATGKLELRGTHANRSKGKKGRAPAVYLWMQTFGELPQGLCEPVQTNGNFIGLTSEESVNFILEHFGVTLDDVRGMVGEPGEHESKHVELYDILAALCEEVKPTVLREVA